MPHPFDATLKSLVADHPGDFAELLGVPRDEPVEPIKSISLRSRHPRL